jgi:hypothetical protein
MYFLCLITALLILILIIIKFTEGSNRKEGFTNNTYDGINSNSDTPWTIEKTTKLVITDILKKIINEINKKTGMSYVFTAYDQLGQEVICPVRTRFTADFFVHEMRNLETRRIIIKFVVNFASKKVDVEYINLSNAFKLPEKQFMDYPAPELILQDDNLLRNEYHIMGLNKSNIEFSILRDDEGRPKKVPTPTEFNKWILPLGIDAAAQNPQSLFPSRRQSTCWDTSGANYIEPQSKLKLGVNNSPMIKMPYIYDNPTINRQKEWNTEYKWLNDLVDNTSGMGRGVASSP